MEPNAVLLTQHDNDSYPVWMLQDGLGIRNDVTVINIDFLLVESYRNKIFKNLKLKPFSLQVVDTDIYEINWETVINHFLSNYKNERPLYLGLTLFPDLYKNFLSKLTTSGLALKFSDETTDIKDNQWLVENVFLLDYIKVPLLNDSSQGHVNNMNLNYLKCFKIIYDSYKGANLLDNAEKIKELSLVIAKRTNSKEAVDRVIKDFE